MTDLLKFEADWKTIQIIYNSLSKKEMGDKDKKSRTSLFPNFGYLYQYKEKMFKDIKDLDTFKEKFTVEYYKDTVKDLPDPQGRDFSALTRTIDDV